MPERKPVDVAALRELCAKATPGPWRYEEAETIPETGEFHEGMVWKDGNGSSADPDQHIVTIRIGLQSSDANGLLIAAARNALPALLYEIEELRKDKARLDWLDEPPTMQVMSQTMLQQDGHYSTWTIKKHYSKAYTRQAIREAIDAAIGSEKGAGK